MSKKIQFVVCFIMIIALLTSCNNKVKVKEPQIVDNFTPLIEETITSTSELPFGGENPANLSHNYVPQANAPINVTGMSYYVSDVDGDDSNIGTIEEPFKTISRAAEVMKAGDACYIREGIYRETVTPNNNGTKEAPILFSAYENESVVISGNEIIESELERYDENIMVCNLEHNLGLGKNQIFVNGEVMLEARYPNVDIRSTSPVQYSKLYPTRGYFSVNADISSRISSYYLDQPENFWAGALYVGGHNVAWAWQSAIVKSSKPGQLTVNKTTSKWWFPKDVPNAYSAEMSEGYLTNTLNALDMAGEWYIGDNKLYIWLPENVNIKDYLLEIKTRTLAFDLTEKENIYIFGINIFASSITMAKAKNCTLDTVLASYTSHFQWFNDARDGYIDEGKRTKENSPMNGQVGIYVSGSNNAIINSTIQYSAGAGIYLAGYGTQIINNIIHDTGYACTYVSGIFADEEFEQKGTKENILLGNYTIHYNTIYNTGRAAISFNSIDSGIAYYAGSDIAYNQFFNTVLFTSDGGAFYSYYVNFSADGKKTKLHHNIFYNEFRRSGEGIIYADNKCEGLIVENNLAWSHYYGDKTLLCLKTDTMNKDNLPVATGDNKHLGVLEIEVKDLPHSAYPNGKGFFTGAMHGEDPRTLSELILPFITPYKAPEEPLSRELWVASASSTYSEINEPTEAIDEDELYSYWRIEENTQSPGDWFMIDMGKLDSFSRIIMKCGTPKSYNSPRSYTIKVSEDGVNWSEPVAQGDSCTHELDIILEETQTTRYVLIEQHEKSHLDWGQFFRIVDIKFYKK